MGREYQPHLLTEFSSRRVSFSYDPRLAFSEVCLASGFSLLRVLGSSTMDIEHSSVVDGGQTTCNKCSRSTSSLLYSLAYLKGTVQTHFPAKNSCYRRVIFNDPKQHNAGADGQRSPHVAAVVECLRPRSVI
jgi:hypothetical protein